jgi:hypothetical protein
MIVNTSNKIIKKLIGETKDCIELCSEILNLVVQSLESNNPRSVFTFSGKVNTGIRLQSINLPKKGYCFFARIYIEAANTMTNMTIFKLSNAKNKAIELFLYNDFLNYQVTFNL